MKKILLGLLFLSRIVLADQAQGFSYSGTLVDVNGTPMGGPVSIGSQILAPNGCVLYQQNDAAVSPVAGNFSIQIGLAPGSTHRVDNLQTSMAQIFANAGSIPAVSAGSCSGYTPSPGDQRTLHISIDQGLGSGPIPLSPDLVISSVPSALVAETLQGLTPSDLLKKIAPGLVSLETGSGVYPVPAGVLYLKVKMVGGGGGGGAGNNNANTTFGGNGGTTSFGGTIGGTLMFANGGFGGNNGNALSAGGTAFLGPGAVGFTRQGGSTTGNTSVKTFGGTAGGNNGTASPFGGAGGGAAFNVPGGDAIANTGSGGGGGSYDPSATGGESGEGGAAGGYAEAIIANPETLYNYTIGSAGAAGSPFNGTHGGTGGSGVIIIEPHYQ